MPRSRQSATGRALLVQRAMVAGRANVGSCRKPTFDGPGGNDGLVPGGVGGQRRLSTNPSHWLVVHRTSASDQSSRSLLDIPKVGKTCRLSSHAADHCPPLSATFGRSKPPLSASLPRLSGVTASPERRGRCKVMCLCELQGFYRDSRSALWCMSSPDVDIQPAFYIHSLREDRQER